MALPALTCNTFEHLATITGVTLKVLELPVKVAVQLTAQEDPALDKPLI